METRAHSITTSLGVLVLAVVASSSSSSAIVHHLSTAPARPISTGAARLFTTSTGSDAPLTFPSHSPPQLASPAPCLPVDQDGKADSEGITAFGMNMFRELAREGNVFFSPYNLWTALTLTYLGAERETSLQMSRVLGVRGKRTSLEYVNNLEKELSERFQGQTDMSLKAASKVYVADGLEIDRCIQHSLADRLQTLAFSNTFEAAKVINRYVNTTTKGHIPTIVEEGQLADTQMAIVTAIYFYGSWKSAFEPAFTTEAPFHPDPNFHRAEKVQMMRMNAGFRLGKSDELSARVLRLPYTNENTAMYILLPTTEGRDGFDATLRALNPTTLQGAINGLTESFVEVQLPKFKMTGNYLENMKRALKKLGATHMFSTALADFSSFSPSLYVSAVAHKAVVDVSEVGTEAAAVTAVILDVRSSRAGAQPFICNRPFIFLIYDDITKVPLFVGAYKKPPRD